MHQLGHCSFRICLILKKMYIYQIFKKKNQLKIYLLYNPVAGLLANMLFSTSILLETLLFVVKYSLIV